MQWGKKIYQGHDIHFLREERAAILSGNKKKLKKVKNIKNTEMKIWKDADCVYYFSKDEIKIIKELVPESKVATLPLYIFDNQTKNEISYNAEKREGLIFVGGFSHAPNLDGIEWFIEKIFPKVIAKIPDIRLYVVGSNPPKSILNMQNKNVIIKGFVPDDELDEIYSKIKMSVVPLRFGAGVKGKIIEAIYSGIPVVTTSIGAEGISQEENLLTVEDDEEKMAQEIVELYSDNKKLNEISAKSSDFIGKYYSKNAVISRFL